MPGLALRRALGPQAKTAQSLCETTSGDMAGLRFRKPLALATLLLCLSVAAAEAASACSPAASTELRAAGGDRRFQVRAQQGVRPPPRLVARASMPN